MKKLIILAILNLVISNSVFAWSGYNWDTGSWIDVETYNHEGRGEGEVEYYDYKSGTYRFGYLDMYSGGSGSLYDYETGEIYSVDMD